MFAELRKVWWIRHQNLGFNTIFGRNVWHFEDIHEFEARETEKNARSGFAHTALFNHCRRSCWSLPHYTLHIECQYKKMVFGKVVIPFSWILLVYAILGYFGYLSMLNVRGCHASLDLVGFLAKCFVLEPHDRKTSGMMTDSGASPPEISSRPFFQNFALERDLDSWKLPHDIGKSPFSIGKTSSFMVDFRCHVSFQGVILNSLASFLPVFLSTSFFLNTVFAWNI